MAGGGIIKPSEDTDPNTVEGTHCPFGVSTVAAPVDSGLRVQVGLVQASPTCNRKCPFFNQAYDTTAAAGAKVSYCKIAVGIDKLLALGAALP